MVILNSAEEKRNYKCRNLLDSKIKIEGLKEETQYIFCLKKRGNKEISPLDCIAEKTLPVEEKRSWLLNEDKFTTILWVSFVFISFSLGIILFTYFLLKKYPQFLRNKNIEIVNPRKLCKNPAYFFNGKELPQFKK